MRLGSGSVWRCSSPSPEQDRLLGGGLAPAKKLPRVKSLGCLEVVRLFRCLPKTVGTRSARRPALRRTFNLNRWAAFRPTCPFLSTAGFMAGPPIRLTRRHGTTTFGSISPMEAAGCRFQEFGRHRSQTTQPAPLLMAERPHPSHLHAKELSSSGQLTHAWMSSGPLSVRVRSLLLEASNRAQRPWQRRDLKRGDSEHGPCEAARC